MATKTDDRQTSAITDPAPGQKAPAPVKLRTPHDYTLTTSALEGRVEELKKLSTKNKDAGYSREANAISADVFAIEHHILPAFREQRELPLVTLEQLEQEILGALRPFVFRAFEGLGNDKMVITPASLDGRKDRLVKTLAERVASFAQDLADRAFNEGLAARALTPEFMSINCVAALRALD